MDSGLENLLEEVGSFGRFQHLLVIGAFISPTLTTWSIMFMVFGAFIPDWWCVPRDPVANQSSRSLADQSARPIHQGLSGFSSDNATASSAAELWGGERGNGSDLWNVTSTGCSLLNAGDDAVCGRVVFASGMSTLVSEFQLICDLAWVPSMIISVIMAGILVGGMIAGQLADSIGRKKTMVSFTVLHSIFNLISAFSVSWQMFTVLRGVIGIASGGLLVVVFSYTTEFIGITRRSVVTSLPFWGMGTVPLSLLVWALPHWSHLQLITAACSALCLLVWIFLPESVRWLVVKGHVAEAHQVLCRMAKWNGRKAPCLSSVQALCSENSHTQPKYSYHHIFSTPRMLKISVVLGAMWFCASTSYYGTAYGIKNLSGGFNLNFFLMSIVELPFPLLVFHLTKWFGRRWSQFGSFLMCSILAFTYVSLNLLITDEEAGNYVNITVIGLRGFIVLAWAVMNLFTAELFPTVVRNIGFGYCNTLARVAGIVAPFTLSETKAFVCYSIIGVLMLFTALAPFLLAETGGQPLQDEIFIATNRKTVASIDIASSGGVEMQNQALVEFPAVAIDKLHNKKKISPIET